MQILKEGTRLYLHHFGCLTRPLIYPLLAQLFGVLVWIILAYESVELTTLYFPNVNPWLLWGIFVLANLPGMYLFLNGFWHYLIWISGLNLVVRQLSDTGGCADVLAYRLRITTRAMDYSLIWTFLFGVVFIPFGIAVIPVAIAGTHPDWYWPCVITAVLILFVGLLLACTLMIFCSLVFQVFAFTPAPAGASLFRSIELVGQGIVKALVVIVASVWITQFVLPTVLTWGLDVTRLTYVSAGALEGVVLYVLEKSAASVDAVQYEYPFLGALFDKVMAVNPRILAMDVTRTMVFTFLSALLLPLGTCWFALLYADLKTSLELSKAPVEVLPEQVKTLL